MKLKSAILQILKNQMASELSPPQGLNAVDIDALFSELFDRSRFNPSITEIEIALEELCGEGKIRVVNSIHSLSYMYVQGN